MLIDSHCHLSFKDYSTDELPDLLQRAADNEVSYMINIGAGEGIKGNEAALALAQAYPQIFATIGVHPHDASLFDDVSFTYLKKLSLDEKVVAIGEIGLDFHYSHSPHERQEEVLHQFIEHALECGKPIMIHDRDAGDRTYEILREHKVPEDFAMIHCFTGTKDLARKYLDAGYFLSFTGIVTFKKSVDLREVVALTPVERMLVETDAPFLAPDPFRGR
ncbi:MAG: hypothetical protein ACD_73C00472G0005, partial [uncultured bacterium]